VIPYFCHPSQAAIQASKEGAHEVTLKHFEWAKDRIIMGAERKSQYIDDKAKLMTAYHEVVSLSNCHCASYFLTTSLDPGRPRSSGSVHGRGDAFAQSDMCTSWSCIGFGTPPWLRIYIELCLMAALMTRLRNCPRTTVYR
jgi:hypothetical protein